MRALLRVDVADAARASAQWEAACASGAEALLLRASGGGAAFLHAALASPSRPRIYVEIAPVESDDSARDLEALAGCWPAGVALRGCAGRADLQHLSAKLALCEAMAGVAPGATRIMAYAGETPAAIFGMDGYSGATARLDGLIFAPEPLRAHLSPETQADAPALGVAAGLVVLAAAAAGVPALIVTPERGDPAAVATACAAARRAGFSGAVGQSREQIESIRAAFASPA